MALAPPGANRNRAAFTLLEVLGVVAIIGILTAIMMGAGRRATDSGRQARARAELAVLSSALENYRSAHGDYPRTDDAAHLLQSLVGRRGPTGAQILSRTLIETARFTTSGSGDPLADPRVHLLDPWGSPYRYAHRTVIPWTNPGYVLYSAGPDGRDFSRLLAGGFPDPAGEGNADNLQASP